MSYSVLAIITLCAPVMADAQQAVLNLYTARHYSTDEALYANFTKTTGIKLNRIEGGEDALFERIRAESANSPADVFITVDIGRLWQAEQVGIFAPVRSAVLEARIPPHFRDPAGGWFGYSARARMIVYDKSEVKPGDINDYEDLADARWQRKVCVRSSGHPYMLSLIASIMVHNGEANTETWAKSLVANLARPPKGGDTDQILGVAAGQCAVAVVNQYYFVRLMRSTKPEDRAAIAKLGVVWPNQKNRGTHMNISGGGMLKHAPHREAAVKFLEYLASDEAQSYFADGNNEWPTVASAKINNPALQSLGTFKQDTLAMAKIGAQQSSAQKVADRAGYR
ncbi:MAG: Fe(3+) ABC transporter substrate-binding protein [Betaproteobacteria bacterium]|nr:Fe(3+) ABC transporter substrate-binding protein [Betaproteobacteria bacterium]